MSLFMLSLVVYILSVIIVAATQYWCELRYNWRELTVGELIRTVLVSVIPVANTVFAILIILFYYQDYIYEPYIKPLMEKQPFAKD